MLYNIYGQFAQKNCVSGRIKMKLKHLPLIALVLIVTVIVSILVFKPSGFNFELNVKKYHTADVDGKEFIFLRLVR